jgi:hypothetical protein
MEYFPFERRCIIGWIEDRLRELAAQGVKVDMTIAGKYLLSEPITSTGLEAKVDIMELDPIDPEGESE